MPVAEFRHDGRQALVRVAILPPIHLATGGLQFEGATALIDTGATATAIDVSIADRLRLPRLGKTIIKTPSGDHVARRYQFRLGIFLQEDATAPCVLDRELFGISATPGRDFAVLLGMDVLGRGDLHLRRDGAGTLTFD